MTRVYIYTVIMSRANSYIRVLVHTIIHVYGRTYYIRVYTYTHNNTCIWLYILYTCILVHTIIYCRAYYIRVIVHIVI